MPQKKFPNMKAVVQKWNRLSSIQTKSETQCILIGISERVPISLNRYNHFWINAYICFFRIYFAAILFHCRDLFALAVWNSHVRLISRLPYLVIWGLCLQNLKAILLVYIYKRPIWRIQKIFTELLCNSTEHRVKTLTVKTLVCTYYIACWGILKGELTKMILFWVDIP